jgi:Carboxypeptidase regulatory-like domain/TonB-dependent Receptor Plug Domain
MRALRRFTLRLALAAAGLVMPAGGAGQTGLATVTGILSDESGAALPGVTVVVTNQATNIVYTGVTNQVGNYIITSVPIGTYIVSVQLQGFKSAQSTVTLSAAQTARVDFKLAVGAVEERIDVVATSAVLQTENAVVGTKLERDQIEQLPVQGRNVSALTLYTPGTTQPNMGTFNGLRGAGRPFVNGQQQQSNNFTIDGIDSNEAINNGIAYQPSPDAVEQVSVETLNYSAELGNVAGAVVNMVIKSGTNQLHGNGFYYWRDNELAATPWATNRAGGTKSKFSRNVFGGTLGGPILRNRVFFFTDYQGGRDKTPPNDAFVTVAPVEWRRGDLSSLLPRFIVRDPVTGQPFPNNQIPVERFSSFARSLFADTSLYPLPNVDRPLSDFRQNYRGLGASDEQADQFDVKVDLNGSTRDKLNLRYSWQANDAGASQSVMPLLFNSSSNNPSWSMGANWNRVIGSAVVNDLLVGYSSTKALSDPLDPLGLGKLNTSLGIGGDQAVRGLPRIDMGNNVTSIGNAETGTNNYNQVYQVNERLTWLRGRHTFKFGGSWNYYLSKSEYPGNNGRNGFISYDTFNFTGAQFADFLLDQVSQKGRGSQSEGWTHLQHRVAAYAGDDFKITNNLTLNLGLRWAFTSPFVEKDNLQANIDLTNAQVLLAGEDGNSRALYEPFYRGWEPRVGFAYQWGDRWVYRGGYAVTQYMEGTGANQRLPLNPPFFFESQVRYDTTTGPGTITTGFSGLQPLDRIAGQLRAWDPDIRPQFTRQWNVFAEYLIGSRSSINVGYVGSRSTNVINTIDANQPLPGTGDPVTWLPSQQRRPLYRFNPDITFLITTISSGFHSEYDALQTTFKQRLWRGLEFSANYTLSESTSNARGFFGSGGVAAGTSTSTPVNSRDPEDNYGPAYFDARHIASVAGNYELPFGRGRPIGSGWNRTLDAIAGGWSLSFAWTAHSGYPITVLDSANPSLQASRSTERPNRIGSGAVEHPTLDRWIDRSAFVTAPLGTFGDSGIGILRAPGFGNTDLSVSKRFATFAGQYLLFRGEFFNAFNHPNFGPPVANIQSQSFGTITSTVNDARIIQLVAKYYF